MGSYAEHQLLIKEVKIDAQLEVSGIRIFDRHVGIFYTKRNTPIRINLKGMADCYALLPTKHGLIHIEMEFKTGNSKQSKEQKNWQNFIESIGGIYLLVRNKKDCIKRLKEIEESFK